MANENEIVVAYPVSGLATITVAIYKPDLTIRDSQTAVALVDTDHLNLYSNAGSITIEAGDVIKPAVAGVSYGNGGVYKEAENDVWDAVLTGATHNITTSAGRRLRTLASAIIRNEVAQGPGNGVNQIQFDAAASSTDGAYDPSMVILVGGTGAGQARLILEYDGTTKIATIDRNWKIQPDATSEFNIIGDAGRQHVNEGLAQGGTANTITLNVLASDINDTYKNQMIFLRAGQGEDQARRIIAYDGATKTATISEPWAAGATPDGTTAYMMIPFVCVETQALHGTELTDSSGANFQTFFNNAGRASAALIGLLEADKVIVTSDAPEGPWKVEYRDKVTKDVILTQTLKNTDGENITSINNVLGRLEVTP